MTTLSASTHVVALDIGGTKIRAGLVDGDGRAIVATTRATDGSDGRRSILSGIDAAIGELLNRSATAPVGIGIATAGVVDAAGTIVDATPSLPDWKGTALADHVRERWGLPVRVENDGKATLIAELASRPALRDGIAVLLTLGTGLGGAIAIDGRVLDGAGHVTGHFGMSRSGIDAHGRPLPLEHYVSGAGLARLMAGRANRQVTDSRAVLAGVRVGDPVAVAARDAWVDRLAALIADLRWMLDPHWLVLGGGVVDARDCWWDRLEERLAAIGARLSPVPASHGSDAAMLGAARIALAMLEEQS